MGALLTYALDSNNQLVHVDSVEKGSACQCYCPHCKSPLDAKNGGEIREHHFAHAHGHYCEGAYESALHLLAKQIIQEEGGIMLPDFEDGSRPSGFVQLRDVKVERMDEKYGIKPDVEGIMPDGRRLLIECLVTHKVDGKKYRTIIDNGLLCVEINMKWYELDKKVLREFLTQDTDRRQWITLRERKNPSGDFGSFYQRNPRFDKAKGLLKDAFYYGKLSIRRQIIHQYYDYRYYYTSRVEDKCYNLRELGYDTCEVDANFRGIKHDLLLFRSRKEKEEDKGYISINFRGKRRCQKFHPPRGLRIIDVILRDESDEELQYRFFSGILSCQIPNIEFLGCWKSDEEIE